MGYEFVRCGRTEFAVDWGVLERLNHSYWVTAIQYELAEALPAARPDRVQLASGALPPLSSVEVDWPAVRSRARRATDADLAAWRRRAPVAMPDIAVELKQRVAKTAQQRRAFREYLRDVQADNVAVMQDTESRYTGLIDALRFVRDLSADIVGIGSTIVTGGAAGAALLGGSSAMKGFGKYQDTGRVGASVLYGAGSMILGRFKLGGAKLGGHEYTLILAQGALDGATGFAAGDSFAQAVGSGALKVATAGGAHALFEAKAVKTFFDRLPVPFAVWSKVLDQPKHQAWEDVADTVLAKTAKKLTEKAAASKVKGALKPQQPRTVAAGLADEAPVEEFLLLCFALVNMDKGIGRGW